MRNLIFTFIILCSALVQTTLLNTIALWGNTPDILLICAVMASFLFEKKPAIMLSFFAGICKDMFGGSGATGQAIIFPIFSYAIVMLCRKISLDSIFLRSITAGLVAFLVNSTTAVFLVIFSGISIPAGICVRTLLVSSLYTAALSPLVIRSIIALCPRRRINRRIAIDNW
jgi:rod shape-determining protein MreD